jgi:hypothetical protein
MTYAEIAFLAISLLLTANLMRFVFLHSKATWTVLPAMAWVFPIGQIFWLFFMF